MSDYTAGEVIEVKTIICDRCNKETDNWSGSPEFRVCNDCFNELQESERNGAK